MAHNVSERQRRTLALQQTFAAWPSWFLEIDCSACSRRVTVRMADLDRRWPATMMGRWMPRLRCAGCGSRPARVALVSSLRTDRHRNVITLWPG